MKFMSDSVQNNLIEETIVSVQFEGYEVLEKRVKASGNSGRVYLPSSWVGSKVKIVRVTKKLTDDQD